MTDEEREKKREYQRRWHENNPEYRSRYYKENKDKFCKYDEKRREYNLKWVNENRDRMHGYLRKYYKENKDKLDEYYRNERNMLGDGYILRMLRNTGWEKENITPEIIEKKRLQLTIKRAIREAKNGPNRTRNNGD